jgi:hypothetical protein
MRASSTTELTRSVHSAFSWTRHVGHTCLESSGRHLLVASDRDLLVLIRAMYHVDHTSRNRHPKARDHRAGPRIRYGHEERTGSSL